MPTRVQRLQTKQSFPAVAGFSQFKSPTTTGPFDLRERRGACSPDRDLLSASRLAATISRLMSSRCFPSENGGYAITGFPEGS